jgi:hypothetical protein
MGKIRPDGMNGSNGSVEDLLWVADVALEYPTLAEWLAGRAEGSEALPAFEPWSLKLFSKAGQLRFSLSQREGFKSYFGHVRDPKDVLGSVNASIEAGDMEPVIYKNEPLAKKRF